MVKTSTNNQRRFQRLVEKEFGPKMNEGTNFLRMNLFSRFNEIKPVPVFKVKDLNPCLKNFNYCLHDGTKVVAYVFCGYVFSMRHFYV